MGNWELSDNKYIAAYNREYHLKSREKKEELAAKALKEEEEQLTAKALKTKQKHRVAARNEREAKRRQR